MMLSSDRNKENIPRLTGEDLIAASGGTSTVFHKIQLMVEVIVRLGITLFLMQKKTGIHDGLYAKFAERSDFHADQFIDLPIVEPKHNKTS